MTYTIALVACSAAKLDYAAPAQDLYQSQLFKKAAAYAEQAADEWWILSAEHGLLHPTDLVMPYDTKLTAGTSKAWGKRTQAQLINMIGQQDRGEVELVVLAGKHYRTAVEGLNNVRVPMQGLGIGKQLGWLTKQLDDLELARWEAARTLPKPDTKLTAREQLELIEALPYGQAREKMLRLILAEVWHEGWHEGWETCYGDGGEDNNPYMTGRELIARREQRKADHDAYVMAQVTGARGSSYTVERADGSSVTGSWGQL